MLFGKRQLKSPRFLKFIYKIFCVTLFGNNKTVQQKPLYTKRRVTLFVKDKSDFQPQMIQKQNATAIATNNI